MAAGKDPARYSLPSIILHWGMLLVLAAVYASIELREFWPKGSAPREALKSWHFMLGLSVFGLVWLRVLARLIWPSPSAPQGPGWRNLVANVTHLALYILMIGMPVAGWIILSAEGKTIPFFGFELWPLVSANSALAEQVEELHELGGSIGYWLIGLHAVAALIHHYILRDNLLFRMRLFRA